MYKITRKQIDEIVKNAEGQADILIGVYKLVFPDWDELEKVGGFPTCSKAMSEYMFRKCGEFDRKHHPDVIAGGLWMNMGFSTLDNDHVIDENWYTFMVNTSECTPEKKETA